MPGMTLGEQAELFGSIVMSVPDGVIATDLEGTVVWVNQVAAEMFGWSREKLLGLPVTALLSPKDHDQVHQIRERVLGGERARPFLVSGLRCDGETFDLSVTLGLRRNSEGHSLGTNLILQDSGTVANLREDNPEAEQALRESEARFRAIAETSQEGILAVSPEGDILFANGRLTEIIAMSLEEIYALGGHGIFAPSEAAAAARRLAERDRDAGPERYDFAYRHPDGSDRVLSVSASSLIAADGSVLGSLAMVSDVTSQRASEESLRRAAMHDALTGLPNRLLFLDRLATADARQARSRGRGVAVLFLDLDNFKQVNDVHGHATGDRVLVQVAARVAESVRATDTVARIGGDEFAVISEDTDAETATAVASRIQKALEAPVALEGERFLVSVSIGIALSPPHPVPDLLRLADVAMYQAKVAPHGSAVVYDGRRS
jgi:diguanylate cyclase (GGDEF)-like protein/PAS domain S-box-containing protein